MTDRWDEAASRLAMRLDGMVYVKDVAKFARTAYEAGAADMRERAKSVPSEWLRLFADTKIDFVPADKYARSAVADIHDSIAALPLTKES